MNIFVCDQNPVKAALALPDKHLVKMPVECVQMLVSACLRHGIQPEVFNKAGTLHKGGYPNHPCTQWVGDSLFNARWCWQWGQELCWEYTHRYGREHACLQQLIDVTRFLLDLPQVPMTPFVRAMPDYLRNDTSIDTITAYRRYLVGHKPWATWQRDPSRKPAWWQS